MSWYTASIITAIKLTGSVEQETYPVFEDFHLLQADSPASAATKANNIGLKLQELDDQLELDGKPANREFLGIRKIRSVCNPPHLDLDSSPPLDGAEVSHSYFEVHNKADLLNLALGKRVMVEYVDDDED